VGPPPPWWGLAILAAGALSGVIGVICALAQHDLKRLLAYHTIENVGIILLGVGMGFLGIAWRSQPVAVLGFAGGLLHVVNHGIFKSLLFFGAGSVLQATGTRDIERLGGLARKMPWTAGTFLVAAAAISGLPPLNGFVSEWLVYSGLFRGVFDFPLSGRLLHAAGIAALAMIGGLAAACFAKAFGVVFLGSARSEATRGAHECGVPMRAAMGVLALACAAIGLLPATVAAGIALPVAADLAGAGPAEAAGIAAPALAQLAVIGRAALLVLAVAGGLALLRRALLAGREVATGATWGCGYGAPTPRMQYTASSFADPLLRLSRRLLEPHVHDEPPEGYFPRAGRRETHTPDLAAERVYRPVVRAGARLFTSMRWMQQGRLQLYLLYILVTVLALLLVQLLGGDA
jgi:hydrogenase-4 component B